MATIFQSIQNAMERFVNIPKANQLQQPDASPTNCSERFPDEIPGTHYVRTGRLTIPVNNGRVQSTLWNYYDRNCDHRLDRDDSFFSDTPINVYINALRYNGVNHTIKQLDLITLEFAVGAVNDAYDATIWLKKIPKTDRNKYSASSWQTIERKFGENANFFAFDIRRALTYFHYFKNTQITETSWYRRRESCNAPDFVNTAYVDYWFDITKTFPPLKTPIKEMLYKLGEILSYANSFPFTEESKQGLHEVENTTAIGIVDGANLVINRLYKGDIDYSYVNSNWIKFEETE